jgi:hypothetical protein
MKALTASLVLDIATASPAFQDRQFAGPLKDAADGQAGHNAASPPKARSAKGR